MLVTVISKKGQRNFEPQIQSTRHATVFFGGDSWGCLNVFNGKNNPLGHYLTELTVKIAAEDFTTMHHPLYTEIRALYVAFIHENKRFSP